jgi:predicted NAD-dependent protein-ADP-ribosyltransferase YbiA (DUF1768 family)
MEPCLIGKVRDEFGWMSNMSPHPITHEGIVYPRAEHLFQCMRYFVPEELARKMLRSDVRADQVEFDFFRLASEIQEAIRAEKNPMKAKMIAKGGKNLPYMTVKPLSEQDIRNMKMILRLKLGQHSVLRDKLLATGLRPIIEDCTRRQRGSALFWGAARQDDDTWKGENWLGRLWMQERFRLANDVFRKKAEGPGIADALKEFQANPGPEDPLPGA